MIYLYIVGFTFGSCIHVFMYIHSYIDSIYILECSGVRYI